MLYFDTETCGLHGPTVTIQYAYGVDGEVMIHHVWYESIFDTLQLIEEFCQHEGGVCGFNIVFDWFHLCQTYTTLALLAEKVGMDERPIDHIDLYASLEPEARNGPCLKPVTALDLMLHARKGPFQKTMERKDIRIRRVPKVLGQKLADELSKRIILPDILFARQKDIKKRWTVTEIKDDPDFVHVDLRFKPSGALKVLVADALNVKEDVILKFGDVGPSKKLHPAEYGWAPFALAVCPEGAEKGWWGRIKKAGKWVEKRAWPALIKQHASHWMYDTKAVAYGKDDVKYLQQLFVFFGRPEPGDEDSILACAVGANRWKGFKVDLDQVKKLHVDAEKRKKAAPTYAKHVQVYVSEVMNEIEKTTAEIKGSSKRAILEKISRWKADCDKCKGEGGDCKSCSGSGEMAHPAAERASSCLKARQARTEQVLYDKLMIAGRLHVSVKIIGALSGRMAGADGLNPQGIQHTKIVRKAFLLAFAPLILCGGDFASFEISIAEADYNDPELRRQLLTCFACKKEWSLEQYYECLHCPHCGAAAGKCGSCKKDLLAFPDGKLLCQCDSPKSDGSLDTTLRKIHGLFAMELFPGKTYEEILASKATNFDMYDYGKKGIFSQLFGGDWSTLVKRLSIEEEPARRAEMGFATRYKGVGEGKRKNYDKFCSMRQPGGIGSQVFWHDPHEYAESLNGFRRYFTLENEICKQLFELANDPPEEWTTLKLQCVRRDRTQKVGGAVRSALFAAAFGIQGLNMRAAQNHRIQSTGARLTKELQVDLWEMQPVGVHKWHIQLMNIHDEVMSPVLPELKNKVKDKVARFVERKRSLVPLLKMDFSSDLATWADKG
jgi:hypothetical protein